MKISRQMPSPRSLARSSAMRAKPAACAQGWTSLLLGGFLLLGGTGALHAGQPGPAAAVEFGARSGAVAGEVLDARNGAPLAGAEIRVGDRFGTITATDGSFLLRDVPAGEHNLVVRYLGYKSHTAQIQGGGAQPAPLSISLSQEEGIVVLGAFSVSAEIDAEMRSKNRERNAGSLTSIISSDALGNLPDTQVADALRRVPGISTIRNRGEGDTIVIRGADPSLNSINLDGVAIQSNTDDGLSVSLNTFLVEQLASISVVKSLTPDLPADSVGGYVNLETKSPLDYKRPVFTVNANVDFNSTRREATPRAGVSYLTQFGREKQFGLSLTASYQKRSAEAWRIESGNWVLIPGPIVTPQATHTNVYVPATVEARTNRNDRERHGVSFGFDWKVLPGTRLFAKANVDWQNEYEPGERQRFVFQATAPANFNLTRPFTVVGNNVVEATTLNRTTATAERSITSLYQDITSTILKIGGRTDTDRLRLNYSAGYSRTRTETDQVFATFVRTNVDYRYFQRGTDRPHAEPVAAINVNDPSIYPLNGLNFTDNSKDYDLVEAKFDVAYAAGVLGRTVTFKAGGSAGKSKKVRDDTPRNSAAGAPLVGQTLLLSDPRIKLRRLPGDFLESYDLGVGPEGEAMHAFSRRLLADGQLNIPPNTTAIANDYTIEQKIHTAYALGDFKLGPTANIAGVRYERTVDDGVAFALGTGTGTTNTRITNHRSYDFLAPSFNTRIRFNERWQARLAYTETMRRPGYDSAAPRTTYSIGAGGVLNVSSFNPDLKQQTSFNFDASLDWYFSRADRVTAGVFYKQIADTLYRQVTTPQLGETPPEVQALFPAGTPRTTLLTLVRQANGGDAEIRGLELEYLHRFGFLPSLALTTNFSYIESEWTRVLNNGTVATTRFPQQSRTTGNLALDWTRGKWYVRASYNWRGAYLLAVNQNNRDLDQWGGNAEAIDLKISYHLTSTWSLQFKALNLKRDADSIWLGSGLSRLRQYERSGADYSLGVSWRK
ncbi:MAG: TonB-dependent receptor [Opitutus sp.]|nr:TonB-dependent receptor [Opitutus sp.]